MIRTRGYGSYGRHNREYNKHELVQLLQYCGFDIEQLFSADVHKNYSSTFFSIEQVARLVHFRSNDLGQYLFSRSRNVQAFRDQATGLALSQLPRR